MKIKLIDFGYKHTPKRAHHNDTGADVYCTIDKMVLPGHTVAVPLGFGIVLPDGFSASIFPRSSMAKDGMPCQLPPIDAGYRGEIHAIITNISGEVRYLHEGDRIGQLVVMPTIYAEFVTDTEDNERGDGSFGSTGR